MATETDDSTAAEPTAASKGLFDHRRREWAIEHGIYLVSGGLLLFLWLPLAVMLTLSFTVNSSTLFPFEGVTLAHYQATFADDSLMTALGNSAEIATISASIATLFGVLASFALVRFDFRFKESYRTFGILPMVIPGVVLGIALLIYFRSILMQLPFVGDLFIPGYLTVVLTHSIYGFPFVLLIVTSRLYTYDESLEEAARDLGADPFTTLRDVTLPIIAPAVGAGFLFAWIRSFEDFIRVHFVKGTFDVLTTTMFSMIKYGTAPKMNAISSFIVFVIAVGLAVAMNLGNVTGYVAGEDDD